MLYNLLTLVLFQTWMTLSLQWNMEKKNIEKCYFDHSVKVKRDAVFVFGPLFLSKYLLYPT